MIGAACQRASLRKIMKLCELASFSIHFLLFQPAGPQYRREGCYAEDSVSTSPIQEVRQNRSHMRVTSARFSRILTPCVEVPLKLRISGAFPKGRNHDAIIATTE